MTVVVPFIHYWKGLETMEGSLELLRPNHRYLAGSLAMLVLGGEFPMNSPRLIHRRASSVRGCCWREVPDQKRFCATGAEMPRSNRTTITSMIWGRPNG